ncbi:MAG: hypothetical protein RLZZ60_689 [Bacteroidota bacterium]|jgi:hypothetical protein
MRTLKISIALLALSIVLIQCKKNKNEVTVNSGPTTPAIDLLTNKNWLVSSLISNGTDIWNTPFVSACNKDNQYRFRKNDTLSLFDMSNKCNTSDPDSTNSYFKLYNNNTQLVLNVKLTSTMTINDTADILELTDNALKLNVEYTGIPGTLTFKHP